MHAIEKGTFAWKNVYPSGGSIDRRLQYDRILAVHRRWFVREICERSRCRRSYPGISGVLVGTCFNQGRSLWAVDLLHF